MVLLARDELKRIVSPEFACKIASLSVPFPLSAVLETLIIAIFSNVKLHQLVEYTGKYNHEKASSILTMFFVGIGKLSRINRIEFY